MASLRKAAAHSEKLAAENISLSEKVLSLRSELARRGTQSTSVEDLHAGRDGLQQQLETLRGDLESEKTACERIRAKELQQAGEISDLTMHLEEMRKQISEQLEARSREERYAKQQSLEWERQRTALEEKIGLLHQKPRPTKDQSQETKNNVREGNPKANDNDRRRPQSRSVPAQHQTPARFNSDMAIGTPGAVQPNGRHKRAAALPGDKSAFSITPFLNRTSAKRNSPSSSEEDSDELHAAGEERRSSDRGGIAASKRLRNATLSEDLLENPSKQRLNAHVSISSGIPANTHPDALSDHSDGGEQGEDLGVLQDQPIAGLSLARAKKRKLGVQRGSDEFEDIGSTKNPERTPALGVGRKPAMSGLQQPNIPGNSRPVRLPRSRVFSGLAGFSPLKRDRK